MDHQEKSASPLAGNEQRSVAASRRPTGRGLLLTIVLGLVVAGVARWSGSRLEAEARDTIRADLDANGLSWAQLTVSGRRAHLNGSVPQIGDGSRALEVARASQCDAWLVTLPCARTVSADFGVTMPSAEVWPDLSAHVDDGVLTLRGEVGDQTTLEVVLDAARTGMGPRGLSGIVHDVRVTETQAPSGSQPLLKRLTAALALCHSGEARLSKGATSLHCEVVQDRETSVRELLASPLPAGTLSELTILVAEDLAP